MEHFANAFDQPIESREHRRLAETVSLGGVLVTVRYWLGRLLHRNLFRESDEALKISLGTYLAENGYEKGSRLVSDLQSWSAIVILLRHKVESTEGKEPPHKTRLIAALQAVLADPTLTDAELATIAKTTEKQISRLSDVFVLRKLWNLQSS